MDRARDYTHQRSCSFSTETKDDSCGSGNRENQTQIEKEFGERFIDISNVDLLADQLIAIIKENLWV